MQRIDDETLRSRLASRMRAPRKFAALAAVSADEMEDDDRDAYRAALDRVEQIAAEFELGELRSLIFSGSFGTGKTRLAVRLLGAAYRGLKMKKVALKDNAVPMFIKATELVEMRFNFRDAPEDEIDERALLRDRAFNAVFIVLDDIGRIAGYKGEEEFIERVIEHRYENDLPTLVTASTDKFDSARLLDFLQSDDYEHVIFGTRSRRSSSNG